MNVELVASPADRVTAGSTLSLTLLAWNASPLSACGVTVAVPIPYGASYVERSLFRDAVRLTGDEFFCQGCEIGDLRPGERTAFIWKLQAEPGDEPIRIVPQIFAGVTRVHGAEPVEIARLAPALDPASAYREFERAAGAYFAEIFGRPAPASLQQALCACALACALDAERNDSGLAIQAQVLHRLARAVRGHYVTGVEPNFLMELQGLRDARLAAATIEGLRAFAALDVAARNLAANDRVRDPVPFA